MKKLRVLFLILFVSGCCYFPMYVPNNPPSSEYSFGFHGRVERLEDAFFSSGLSYKERDFNEHSQRTPEYEFVIIRSDTTIKYVVTLEDCQSIYYLVKFDANWNCDSSHIHIDKFSSNIASLTLSHAASVFKTEVVDRLTARFDSIKNDYRWAIEKKQDTVLVKVLNQKDYLRKLYIYALDSISNSVEEKEIISYMGDSTIIYQNDPKQRYVYLKSKRVIYK